MWGDYMKDCIDRRVTPPKRVTSPNWVPHLYVNHRRSRRSVCQYVNIHMDKMG